MSRGLSEHLVLAIYPTSKGFTFALFEGPLSPFDWGMRESKGKKKNVRALTRIRKLLEKSLPDHLVIEDTSGRGSRRSSRIQHLYDSIARLALEKGIEVYRYPQSQVRAAFAAAGAHTRSDIAEQIAKHIPAFSLWLPRKREIWTSEDQRQSLFDAIALALVHYNTTGVGSSYNPKAA